MCSIAIEKGCYLARVVRWHRGTIGARQVDATSRHLHAWVEGNDGLRVACFQCPGEAGKVGLVVETVHLVGEAAAIDPPARDPLAPAERPLADDRLPLPLELRQPTADRLAGQLLAARLAPAPAEFLASHRIGRRGAAGEVDHQPDVSGGGGLGQVGDQVRREHLLGVMPAIRS